MRASVRGFWLLGWLGQVLWARSPDDLAKDGVPGRRLVLPRHVLQPEAAVLLAVNLTITPLHSS